MLHEKAKNEKFQKTNLKEELLYQEPHFFTKWGISIFFTFFIIIFFILYFLKFTETITVNASLESNINFSIGVSNSNEELIKLFVDHGKYVEKNELIGYLSSSSDIEEVFSLSKTINFIISILMRKKIEEIINLELDNFKNLGDLNYQYLLFKYAFSKMKSDLIDIESNNENVSLTNSEKAFKIYNSRVLVHNLNTFNKVLNMMADEINNWEKRYLLKAPIEGNLYFFSNVSTNSNIIEGDKIFYICSSLPCNLNLSIFLPLRNHLNLKLNQLIPIKFEDSAISNITLKAKIISIEKLKDSTLVRISVPNPINEQLLAFNNLNNIKIKMALPYSLWENVFPNN